jgi:hypothetical protein
MKNIETKTQAEKQQEIISLLKTKYPQSKRYSLDRYSGLLIYKIAPKNY